MLVDLDVVYTAEVRMPRHRTWRSVLVKHRHTLKIEELSDEQAPVVGRRRSDAFPRAEFDITETIRYAGGKFWRELPRDTHTEVPERAWHTPESFAELVASPNSADSDHPVPYRAYDHQLEKAYPDPGATGAAQIDTKALDDVIAKADAGADRFMIVDGRVYVTTSEPVYVYTGRSSYRNSYLDNELSHGSITRIFRLDDFDEMLAFANRCTVEELRSHYPEIVAEHEANRAQVLLPGLLRWDPKREALHKSVGSVVESARKVAPDMTVEAFSAYAALRDRVGDDNAAVDDEELATRADLLIGLIRSVRTWVPGRHDWHQRDELRAEDWLQSRRDLEEDLELIGSVPTP